jgi:hypothetical protein
MAGRAELPALVKDNQHGGMGVLDAALLDMTGAGEAHQRDGDGMIGLGLRALACWLGESSKQATQSHDRQREPAS